MSLLSAQIQSPGWQVRTYFKVHNAAGHHGVERTVKLLNDILFFMSTRQVQYLFVPFVKISAIKPKIQPSPFVTSLYSHGMSQHELCRSLPWQGSCLDLHWTLHTMDRIISCPAPLIRKTRLYLQPLRSFGAPCTALWWYTFRKCNARVLNACWYRTLSCQYSRGRKRLIGARK
jgi:hypothetical protein